MRQVRSALYHRFACAPVSFNVAHHPQTGASRPIPGGHERRRAGNRFGTQVRYRRCVSYRIGWPDNRAAHGIAGARTPTPTLTNRLGVALIGAPILAGSGQTPAGPGSTAAPFAGSPLVVTGAGSADGLAASGGGVIPCMAAVSRARKLPISPIALIIGAGNTTVVFFSTPSSASVCRFRSCRASGCAIIVSDASPREAAAIDSPSAAII